jgi:hypothetical protein
MAVGTLPLNAAISATQSLFNQKPFQENLTNNFTSVQNGASNGARAVINGIGTVAGALINLNANAYNLVAAVGQTAFGCVTGTSCSLDQIGNNYENNKNYLQDNFGYDMGDWKQNASIVAVTAAVVAATVFTGGLATTLVGGAIGAGAVATGVGLATAYLVGNVLSYIGGSVMNGKLLDPKEFACGNKEADAIECVSYQGGQLLTGAILTGAVGLVSKNFKPGTTNKVSGVTQGIDDLKKTVNYVDEVDEFGKVKVTDIDPDTGLKRIPEFSGKIDIDHIQERHGFGTSPKASKFNENINIKSLVEEGLQKPPIEESISQGNYLKKIDMGRTIGTTNNRPTSILRIVFSPNGDILSAYPI